VELWHSQPPRGDRGGRTLADAISTKRAYPDIDSFHQRYWKRFAAVIAGPPQERPGLYDEWVDRAWRW
jgi:hypothetical protein